MEVSVMFKLAGLLFFVLFVAGCVASQSSKNERLFKHDELVGETRINFCDIGLEVSVPRKTIRDARYNVSYWPYAYVNYSDGKTSCLIELSGKGVFSPYVALLAVTSDYPVLSKYESFSDFIHQSTIPEFIKLRGLSGTTSEISSVEEQSVVVDGLSMTTAEVRFIVSGQNGVKHNRKAHFLWSEVGGVYLMVMVFSYSSKEETVDDGLAILVRKLKIHRTAGQ